MKVPGPRVEQIVEGVWKVKGELFRYHVESRSGNQPHLVDLSENGFYGQCSCELFAFKYGPKLKHGIPLDQSLMCYHIKKARQHFTESMLRMIWVEVHKPKPQPRVEPQAPKPTRSYQLNPQKTFNG